MLCFGTNTQLAIGDYVIGFIKSPKFPQGHKACGIVIGLQGFAGSTPRSSTCQIRTPLSATDEEIGLADSQDLSKIDVTVGTKSYNFSTRY